jgi:hypothetical protein
VSGRASGRRCRSAPIRDVAKELKLDWHTVKELDKESFGQLWSYEHEGWARRFSRTGARRSSVDCEKSGICRFFNEKVGNSGT